MSTTGPHAHKMYKNSFHWRSDSGELDVFEAARYFSDQIPGKQHAQRRSLDVPRMRNIPPEYHHIMIMDHHQNNNQVIDQNKKFKQPSSPGGRLASFLNSLFNQSHSKKKKKKSKSGPAFVVEDESPGGAGRRKRRSSISHFLSYSNSTDKKPSNANANANANAITPTKSYKISDHNQDISSGPTSGKNYKITLLEEKSRISEKKLNVQKSEERRFGEEKDEGADSDSSSDLFDLPNHDLDFLSSGLPVYGTTHMDTIKHC